MFKERKKNETLFKHGQPSKRKLLFKILNLIIFSIKILNLSSSF